MHDLLIRICEDFLGERRLAVEAKAGLTVESGEGAGNGVNGGWEKAAADHIDKEKTCV